MRRDAARRHEGENEVVGKIAPSYVRSRRSFVAVFTRGYGLTGASRRSALSFEFNGARLTLARRTVRVGVNSLPLVSRVLPLDPRQN